MSLFGKLFGDNKDSKESTPSNHGGSTGAPQGNTTYLSTAKPVSTLNMSKTQKLDMAKDRTRFLNTVKSEKGLTRKYQVAFVIDKSGSMDHLYDNGTVHQVFERLFPVAMSFDDNKSIDCWAFNNKSYSLGSFDMTNFTEVSKEWDKIRYGGTSYEPVLSEVVNYYENQDSNDPVFILFLTDGENDDKYATEKLLINMSHKPIFLQCVGLGNDSMKFLEKLDDLKGRKIDNANFFRVSDINQLTDSDLYNKLLTELPGWTKEAEKLGIIK